jgi:hypothetical protein
MKILWYFLAGVCVAIAVLYSALPGGDLPPFLPGYEAGSTHIHHLHAVAAIVGAIIFLLIGFSGRRQRG